MLLEPMFHWMAGYNKYIVANGNNPSQVIIKGEEVNFFG